jgi:hypothetical protein
MEGVGQKNGNAQIRFYATLLPVESTIPGKVSDRKHPSHFLHQHCSLGASCVFRRTAQPSVMCGALSRVRSRSGLAVVSREPFNPPRGALVKICAAPGDVASTIAVSRPDQRRRGLMTIAFAYDTASMLLTECNSLSVPRFCQTCGRKCRTPCGGRSAKRGLLNNSQ